MKILHRVIGKITTYSPTDHMAVLGWSGTGKGVQAESYFCQYKGKKFDLFSLDRFEGLYYGLPNDSEEFIKMGKLYTNGTYEPEAIPHRIYFIAGKLLVEHKTLPKNIKIISFREEDLDANDWIALLGTSPSSETLMHDIIDYLGEIIKVGLNFENILGLLMRFSVDKKLRDTDIIKRFSSPHPSTVRVIKTNINILKASGIFDKQFDHFDVKEMFECEEAITVSPTMCETILERGIASSLALKKVVEYQKKLKKKENVLVYWREFHYNFQEEYKSHFRLANNYLHYILTQGRDNNLWLLADWQITDGVPKEYRTHFRQIFSLAQSPDGIKALTGHCFIDSTTLNKLPSLERFQGIFISNGEYHYPIFIIPPTCKKKRDGEDVLQVLGDIYGQYSVDYIDDNTNAPTDNIDGNISPSPEEKSYSSTSNKGNINKRDIEE